jgi:hypothetical protein
MEAIHLLNLNLINSSKELAEDIHLITKAEDKLQSL